jgi:hypothetical protein
MRLNHSSQICVRITHNVAGGIALWGEIQTNIDPKRDQTKSLFLSKIFANQDFG